MLIFINLNFSYRYGETNSAYRYGETNLCYGVIFKLKFISDLSTKVCLFHIKQVVEHGYYNVDHLI